jgi:hypothetical protein
VGQALGFVGQVLGFESGGVIDGESHTFLASGSGPIADAIRKEGKDAKVVVGKIGERILNPAETAKYHQVFPNGILNYERGGIIGSGSSGSTGISNSNFNNLAGLLSGKLDVDLKSNGQSQQAVSPELGSKLTQAIRGELINQLRDGGILARYVN